VLYDSGALGNDTVKHVDIDVTGVQQLTLVATNGVADNVYFDHADWADAKLIA
jgi:NPCBM/NEW2 domain-containing protein